jgi:hypothetical protein
MEECTRLINHLNVFNKLVKQLVSVDQKIEENDKVIASSLPPLWEQLVINILIWSCIPITSKILEEPAGIFILG